jgi:hypothetical protein
MFPGSPTPPPTGPSPREIAAQNAFQFAVSTAKDHPADRDEQAKLFEKIVADDDRTPACADAKRELEKIARKRKDSAAAELTALLARARKRDGASEIHEVRAQLAKWNSPRYIEELDKALTQVFPLIAAKSSG